MPGSYNAGSSPQRVVLVDPTTLDDYTAGGTGTGAQQVQGNAAPGATAGNPIVAAGIAGGNAYSVRTVTTSADAIAAVSATATSGTQIAVGSFGLGYNGSTWDRLRTITSAPTGTAASDMPLWTTSDLTRVRVNTAVAGDNTIVAAVSGQTTRVHRMKLSVAGPVIVQVKDGAGTILEVFNFAGNGGGLVLDFASRPWYITTANTAFILNLSAAVQVDGRVEYVTSA